MHAKSAPRRSGVYRLAAGGALFLAVVASALFLNSMRDQGNGELVVLASYPANNAVDVPLEASIQVEFKGSPVKEVVEQGITIAPFVETVVDWERNTLVITPKSQLQPAMTYTITVPVPPGLETSQEERKVFTVTFTTAKADGGTASPASTLTPTPTVAPGVVPTATVTATVQCPIAPVRGFGKVYRENPNVARALGCALDPEKGEYLAEQIFQKGYMFWRNDTRQIYVIMDTGRWAVYPDTWNEGDPSPSLGGAPPAGTMEPVRGFGKVWRERKEVREALGWATAPERGLNGAWEPFSKGAMLWSDRRVIFVLLSDGAWLRFQDTFEG